jgi:2-keto-4-pentenoate hydratase/2-oxohepta-3-ene-1,7-dioic acid hydratase in catechol pathway
MTQIRRRFTGVNTLQVETRPDPTGVWKPVRHFVALGFHSPFTPEWELNRVIGAGGRPGLPMLPFQPLSVRHFDGDAQARNRSVLSLVPTSTRIAVPAGAHGLDYVPRLGFVIGSELSDATPEQASAAISAFVLVNEFSARGEGEPFGTMPTSLSETAVPAADLRDSWRELLVALSVNGAVVGQARAADSGIDLGELLAEISENEHLLPGELFSVDAFASPAPGPLAPGDQLIVAVPRLGRVEHAIG